MGHVYQIKDNDLNMTNSQDETIFDLGTKSLFGWGLVRDRIAFGYGIEVILGIGPIIFGSYLIYDYNI